MSARFVSSRASRRRLCAPLPWHHREPGVQEVVGLLEEAPVVHRHYLHRLGRVVLECPSIVAVQREREGARPRRSAR